MRFSLRWSSLFKESRRFFLAKGKFWRGDSLSRFFLFCPLPHLSGGSKIAGCFFFFCLSALSSFSDRKLASSNCSFFCCCCCVLSLKSRDEDSTERKKVAHFCSYFEECALNTRCSPLPIVFLWLTDLLCFLLVWERCVNMRGEEEMSFSVVCARCSNQVIFQVI